jgi:hypothetical protein
VSNTRSLPTHTRRGHLPLDAGFLNELSLFSKRTVGLPESQVKGVRTAVLWRDFLMWFCKKSAIRRNLLLNQAIF